MRFYNQPAGQIKGVVMDNNIKGSFTVGHQAEFKFDMDGKDMIEACRVERSVGEAILDRTAEFRNKGHKQGEIDLKEFVEQCQKEFGTEIGVAVFIAYMAGCIKGDTSRGFSSVIMPPEIMHMMMEMMRDSSRRRRKKAE